MPLWFQRVTAFGIMVLAISITVKKEYLRISTMNVHMNNVDNLLSILNIVGIFFTFDLG